MESGAQKIPPAHNLRGKSATGRNASGIGPPGPKAGRRPSQNRTSAINASGSSSYDFASQCYLSLSV